MPIEDIPAAPTLNRRPWKPTPEWDWDWGGKRHRRWRCGLLLRLTALWIGAHYSPACRRWCINPIPCVTLWITLPGGLPPRRSKEPRGLPRAAARTR